MDATDAEELQVCGHVGSPRQTPKRPPSMYEVMIFTESTDVTDIYDVLPMMDLFRFFPRIFEIVLDLSAKGRNTLQTKHFIDQILKKRHFL